MLNRKKILIFLSIVVFVAGCNAFVVPASFIVPGIMGNTTDSNKSASSMRQSNQMKAKSAPSGSSSEGPAEHISGTTMSKHISGTATDHISGATMPEHISGTSTDHISGSVMTEHVSGNSIPAHLSGTAIMPEHLSGN